MSDSSWMFTDKVARIIDDADSIERIEFYVAAPESGRRNEIGCRLFSFRLMSNEECSQLAEELNAAIKPVLKQRSELMLSQAANQLRRFL
jgi:hypothetical protein